MHIIGLGLLQASKLQSHYNISKPTLMYQQMKFILA